MGQTIELPDIDLTEPVGVPLVYVEGIARAIIKGDRVHLIQYDDIIGADGTIEHHVVARNAYKIDVLKNAMMLISQAILVEARRQMVQEAGPDDRVLM